MSCGIHLREILQQMLNICILDMSLKIINLGLQPHFSWVPPMHSKAWTVWLVCEMTFVATYDIYLLLLPYLETFCHIYSSLPVIPLDPRGHISFLLSDYYRPVLIEASKLMGLNICQGLSTWVPVRNGPHFIDSISKYIFFDFLWISLYFIQLLIRFVPESQIDS